jgi:alpha-glucosidase (family GH31 glycosyl hydrolase)
VSTGEVLFNTTVPAVNPQFNGLTFEDQFLEISTQLIPNANLYGIGDQKRPFQLDVSGNTTYTLWASDHAMPFGQNIYASHPFYTEVRPASGGLAHGVLLLNSNAMDVFAFPNALNFRTIGGIIDLYFFLGPGPKDVISQYHNFIGLPHMPPYWALGWHQCRYGYQNLQELEVRSCICRL